MQPNAEHLLLLTIVTIDGRTEQSGTEMLKGCIVMDINIIYKSVYLEKEQ